VVLWQTKFWVFLPIYISETIFKGSGSQQLFVGDPQNIKEHSLATHSVLNYYYKIGFNDPK